MAKNGKIFDENGNLIYPLTVSTEVKDPTSGQTVKAQIDEINNKIVAEFGHDLVQLKGGETDITSLFSFTNKKCIVAEDGSYAGSSNVWSATANFISIDGYDSLRITIPISISSTTVGFAFYSAASESNYISGQVCSYDTSLSERGFEELTITIPDGAKYVRITWLSSSNSNYSAFYCYGVYAGSINKKIDKSSIVDDLETDDATKVLSAKQGKKLYDNADVAVYDNVNFTSSKVIVSTNGDLAPNPNFKASDAIPINEGNVVELTVCTSDTTGDAGIAFYDSDDNFLVGYARPNTGTIGIATKTYTAPEDAAYFRTSFWVSSDYTFSCKVYTRIINDQDFGGDTKYASASVVNKMGPIAKTHLRILVFGNSYSCDSWSYVPFILKNYGFTCEIYHWHRGAMSLWDLYEEWDDSSTTGSQRETGGTGLAKGLHYINTKTNTAWSRKTLITPKACLELGGWDMISLQQASFSTIDYSLFEPYLTNIITYIRQSFAQPYVLGWSGMYTRQTSDDPAANLVALETCIKTHPFTLLMPIGTAVFNARTNSTLKATSDSGEMWASDNIHLQEGIPCYLASLTIVQSLLNHFFNKVSVLGDILVPNADTIATFNHPEEHGEPLNVNDETRFLAQKAAIQAVKYPYEITTIG